MEVRCERIVKNVFPLVRSVIAEMMMKEYNMTQVEIAKKLGITQAAVSYYLKGLRAKQADLIKQDRKLMEKIEKFVKEIVYGNIDGKKIQNFFCDVCKAMRDG